MPISLPALKHHIVLVSGQALPTVLGASLPGSEPSHIHAVVTPGMREASRLLRRALDSRGRHCTYTEYSLENNSGQNAMYSVLESIQNACGNESLGVNLTGGTKLMALAASEWAFAYDVPAFYIDTAGEQVITLGREWQYTPLPDVLSVRDILIANSFFIEDADTNPVPAERRGVLNSLLQFACTSHGEKALGHLNRLAEKAAKANLCVYDDGPFDAAWKNLLKLCIEAGTIQTGNGHVAFSDETARRWCNGIWFEEYVKMTLYRLKAAQHIKDFAVSVEVRRKGVKNELDALFSVRNRLFTIECKTSTMFNNATSQPEKVPSVLYKADSLHDRLGGIFARAMLCSVRPLDVVDRERANSLGVRIVCGKDLLSLADKFIAWSKEV